MTIGAVTQFPIAHADVVELEPAVVEAGDRFCLGQSPAQPRSAGPRHHRRWPQLHDAVGQAVRRHHQRAVKPWISGVSNLFTTDYWKLAKSRLADDGVFCQWAQLYELSQPNVKTLLRSFVSVFPYSYVFAAEHRSSDVLLIASKRPLPLDFARLRRNFADSQPTLRAELHRAGVDRAEEVLADLLLVPDEIAAYTAGSPLNTDDNALIEHRAPRDLLGYLRNDLTVTRPYGAEWPYGRFERYLENIGPAVGPGSAERAEFYAQLGRALLSHGKREAAARVLSRSQAVAGGAAADHLAWLLALLAHHAADEQEEPLSRDWDGDERHFVDGLAPLRLPPAALLKPGMRRAFAASISWSWRPSASGALPSVCVHFATGRCRG